MQKALYQGKTYCVFWRGESKYRKDANGKLLARYGLKFSPHSRGGFYVDADKGVTLLDAGPDAPASQDPWSLTVQNVTGAPLPRAEPAVLGMSQQDEDEYRRWLADLSRQALENSLQRDPLAVLDDLPL